MATLLVTGGAGFLGSHLCAALVARGDTPVAIDDLSNGYRENVPDGVELLVADLADASWIERVGGRKFDGVVHCAAQASNALSFRDPERDYRANQLATWNVLRFCERAEVRRLIFTSSMSVYGEPSRLPTPEDEPGRPATYYALHKMAAEQYIRFARGLDATIFRLYTTYGVGQNLANREQGLIKIYLGYVLRGEPMLVHGSGSRMRDVVHVSDVVDAILRSLHEPRTFGKCYNLGTGRSLSVADIIARIVAAADRPPTYPVRYTDADPGDPRFTHADISAARRDFGWEPKVRPEDGIRETVRRYISAGLPVTRNSK